MVLLTLRTLNGIIRVFSLGHRFGCHPYKWNQKTGRAEVSKSWLQIGAWIFNVALAFGYYAFIVFQWRQVTSSDTTSEAVKTFMWFALVYFSFPVFHQLTIFTCLGEIPDFFNMYLRYNKRFEGLYVPVSSGPKALSRLCEYVMVYTYSAFWTNFFVVVTTAFFRPSAPDQMSTLASGEMFHPVRLALYILFTYYMFVYMTNACLMTSTAFGFFFSALQILQKFGSNPGWLKGNDPVERIRIYKILYLEMMAVNRVYKIPIAASKIILIFLAIFCTYGGIRLQSLMAMTLGITGGTVTIFLAVIMTAWSEFHSSSKRALSGLVRASRKERGLSYRILRCEIKSLRLLQICVGGTYVIDKQLLLKVMKIVCEGIIFLLVNY